MNREKFHVAVMYDSKNNRKLFKAFQDINELNYFLTKNKSWFHDKDFYDLSNEGSFVNIADIVREAQVTFKEIEELNVRIKQIQDEINNRLKRFYSNFENNPYKEKLWYDDAEIFDYNFRTGYINGINLDSAFSKSNEHAYFHDSQIDEVGKGKIQIFDMYNYENYEIDLMTGEKVCTYKFSPPPATQSKNKKSKNVQSKKEKKIEARKAVECFIYFVADEKDKHIKIGRTRDVKSRVGQLKTSNPYKLHIVKVIRGTDVQELDIHKMFQVYRVNGEWFEFNEEIRNYIDTLNACDY